MKKLILLSMLAAALNAGCKSDRLNLGDFTEAVQQINNKQAEIFKESEQLSSDLDSLRRRYPEKIGQIKFDSSLGLSTDQEKVIRDLITEEKDASYKGVLQRVVDKEKQVDGLKQQIQEIQAKLPAPQVVKRGDTHARLAMDFLMKSYGMDKKAAKERVMRVGMMKYIKSGNDVWLYYDKDSDTFGTFVTQGTAKENPNKFAERMEAAAIERAVEEAMSGAPVDTTK